MGLAKNCTKRERERNKITYVNTHLDCLVSFTLQMFYFFNHQKFNYREK